jgi:hypothetical protein
MTKQTAGYVGVYCHECKRIIGEGETMIKIKFSHWYDKMPDGVADRKTELVGLYITRTEQLPEAFKIYDTRYGTFGSTEYYALPKGEVIILLLLTDCKELWTTIRRYTPSKIDYYAGHVGEQVEIVYTGE